MSADVRITGGMAGVNIPNLAGGIVNPREEVTKHLVAAMVLQPILTWPENERRVLVATVTLQDSHLTPEEALVHKAFDYANAFEKVRWLR